MSVQSSTTSRTLLPSLANYDIFYADAIVLLSATLAENEEETWSFMNSDGPSTGDVLRGMARRITPLKERYLQLKGTSNNLLLIAQVWMHDASTHTQKQLEEERQKYRKLRDDRHVPQLEARALERLKDLRHAINNAAKEYNNQWKWPDIARPRLSGLGSLSKLEAAAHADQSHHSTDVADVNFQGCFTASEEVRGSTEAASDQYGQSHVVADVKLQGPPSDEVRDSADAASDQYGQSEGVADVNLLDAFTESVEVRGSTDAAPDQFDQYHAIADTKLQDPLTSSGAVGGSTDATLGQSDQQGAVADVALQDSTENGEVRVSADAALDQSDQPDAAADVYLQDPFTKNDEVIGSGLGEENTLSGVCYASVYASSVQTLSAMLQEIDQHRDSTNKEFIQSDDPVREQVIQVLKGASNRVSTVAKKWMKQAATDPVRHRTESQALQTMRKALHVLSLQRRVSGRLQELRSARRGVGVTSTDQHNDQYDDQCKTSRADGPTCSQGLDTSSKSAGYLESAHQPSKFDELLRELKHLRSLQTSANAPIFQEPEKKVTSQPTSQEPEGFQAHPEIADHEGSTTSVEQEVFTQATSQQHEGFQAHCEIANRDGSKKVNTKATRKTQASTTDTTSRAKCQPTVCRWGGGMLRHTSQDISHSLSRTLTSSSTAVKSFDEPSKVSVPSEIDDLASRNADEFQTKFVTESQDLNKLFLGSEAPDQTSDADELETAYQDLNEPSSDSEAPEQKSDAGSEAPDQTSETDQLETAYQDLNESSSDSDTPNQTSDTDELETAYHDLNEPFSDSEEPDQTSDGSEWFDEDPKKPSFGTGSDQGTNEADASATDQFEELAYESDQFEQSASEKADDDADAFDEPSADQSNDEADQVDEPTSDQGNDEANQFDEPISDSEASEQADYDAHEYDEPPSDTEEDNIDSDE